MRFAASLAATILLFFLMPAAVLAAGEDQLPDVSLARPVTIECVNARLHAVLEQLTEKTGVAIRCGRDSRDWQVRDIPVTVCAKDVPLGRLLKAIAASTHLLLSKEQVGQITIYRIWRDSRRRRELDDFFSAKAAADMAKVGWDWDAACKANDAGDGKTGDIYHALNSKMGALLSALGSDGKSQVMSGGVVKLTLQTAPQAMGSLLANLIKDTYQSANANGTPLTPQELQKCGLVVNLETDCDTPNIQISVGIPPTGDRGYTMVNGFLLSGISQYAPANELAGMPKPPEQPRAPDYGRPEGEWPGLDSKEAKDIPGLQTKFSLEAPKDSESITCGSLLAALSKASGYTIVCEDFESHRRSLAPEKLFKRDTTIGTALAGLEHVLGMPDVSGFVWRVNEKDKLIIGTAYQWPVHHRNLVSEALLDYLKTKLDGDGVGLDDYLKVMALESGQLNDWVRNSRDLAILDAYGTPGHKDFWMLYDSLSPQQKAQAQTDEGLRMADLHPAYVAYLIGRYNETETNAALRCPLPMPEPREFPYDDQSIADLVMRVTPKKAPCPRLTYSGSNGDTTPYPAGTFTADTYDMKLEVIQNGETRTMGLGGPRGLPFRSPQREKALGIKPVQPDASAGGQKP